MKFFISLVTLILIVTSCDKPVVKYNPDFEGRWRTKLIYDSVLETNVMSEILLEGKDGRFYNTCAPCGTDLCNCVSSSAGKATMNSDNTYMKIGSTSSFPLQIQEEPAIDSTGTWTMLIQGLRYYKQ